MEDQEKMNRIMGIGPEVSLSDTVSKTLRVGTIKQIRDVAAIYKDDLRSIKPIVSVIDESEQGEQIGKWVDIMNLIFIEGFTREEFEDSIPELMEEAVERFLFSKQGS